MLIKVFRIWDKAIEDSLLGWRCQNTGAINNLVLRYVYEITKCCLVMTWSFRWVFGGSLRCQVLGGKRLACCTAGTSSPGSISARQLRWRSCWACTWAAAVVVELLSGRSHPLEGRSSGASPFAFQAFRVKQFRIHAAFRMTTFAHVGLLKTMPLQPIKS